MTHVPPLQAGIAPLYCVSPGNTLRVSTGSSAGAPAVQESGACPSTFRPVRSPGQRVHRQTGRQRPRRRVARWTRRRVRTRRHGHCRCCRAAAWRWAGPAQRPRRRHSGARQRAGCWRPASIQPVLHPARSATAGGRLPRPSSRCLRPSWPSCADPWPGCAGRAPSSGAGPGSRCARSAGGAGSRWWPEARDRRGLRSWGVR